MSKPRLRAAKSADLPFVENCARAAYAPYVPRIGREPAPMVADFAVHLANGELCIVEAGDPVGYSVHRIEGDALFIENIAIMPDLQGSGVGRAIFDLLEAEAREAGASQLRLYTNVMMAEALAFYERLGFFVTDKRIEDGFHRVYLAKNV
ncbi:MAG: GNAT family N-acetyltransferase [Pseudomonadota bacterium]